MSIRTCAAAYVETVRSLVHWPWRSTAPVRVPLGEAGRGVLVSELLGDEDNPEEDAEP